MEGADLLTDRGNETLQKAEHFNFLCSYNALTTGDCSSLYCHYSHIETLCRNNMVVSCF